MAYMCRVTVTLLMKLVFCLKSLWRTFIYT